jgi:DNA polymerase II small subunit
MDSEQIEDVIYEITKKGFQVEPMAFEKLIELYEIRKDLDLKKALLSIADNKRKSEPHSVFIDGKDIDFLFPKKEELVEDDFIYDKITPNLKVIHDPGNEIIISEGIEGFAKYFLSRYIKLLNIVNSRPGHKAITKIEQLMSNGRNIRIAGLVKQKRVKKGAVLLELEDDSGAIDVYAKFDSQNRNALEALHDQMLIADISSVKQGLAFASDIQFPEVPDRILRERSSEIYVLLLSDLHIGSKAFDREIFEHLIHWLQGQHGDRELVKRLKYVIIAGDLVDGVGVYPQQEKELELLEIRDQYTQAAKYLKEFPSSLQIIIIPGNHDATRQALPQPSIPNKYCKELYELDNVKMFGDPLNIELHGVNFLIYHGRSLDDVFASVPNIDPSKPENIMKILLRARHLAPAFGARTTIAPANEDTLVIDTPPDVLHAGHIHVFGHSTYRGTTIVNSGTFQRQTPHQKSMGINPTPGKVAILSLRTMNVIERDFNQFVTPLN